MGNNINYDYWRSKEICTFDVEEFIGKVCSKYQQMAEADEMAVEWVKTREELRELWDKVMAMPIQGDASLYPNNNGTQPALMEVWSKAGDFWRAGFRAGDELICDQHGLPLRKWMIKAIKSANGEAECQDSELYNFTAIDFETANSDKSSICEIGVAVVVNGVVKDVKSWMVQPPGNSYDEMNILKHRITPEDTKDSPAFAEVWPEVLPYLEGRLVVAHNTAFDMYALRDALDRFGIAYPSFTHVCSCRLSKKIIPGLYNYRLGTVSDAIGFHMERHHRAGVDAEACAMVFLACLERADVQTLEDLQKLYAFHCGKFADGTFLPQKAKGSSTSAKDIFGNPDLIDEGNYFYGKEVCFTGACSYGTRDEMRQRVADVGGIPAKDVTKRTQVLVVGQQDYRVVGESGLSSKQKKAMKLRDEGQDIEILSESEFLEMI